MKLYPLVLVSMSIITMICFCQKGESTQTIDPVNQFRSKHIINQYKSYGFVCSSTGGGGDGKRYRHLKLGFDTHERLNIRSARKYLVKSILNFIEEVNHNTYLAEHFTEWPFTTNKLTYTINVKIGEGIWPKFPNGPTFDEQISYVLFTNEKIYYKIDVHPKKLPQTIHSETLEEAIAILKSDGWNKPDK